ncbi:MAG: peptide chain release factor 2 [Acholeplasmatales bacterium]|jgi:peptide chain release factor 2|nr:peptide chain release factor 2 [Acholeplasmatales bacterium]
MDKYEINKNIALFDQQVNDLLDFIDKDATLEKKREIDLLMEDKDFWNDSVNANQKSKELKRLEENLSIIKIIEDDLKEIHDWYDVLDENEEFYSIIDDLILKFKVKLEKYEIQLLLSGSYDSNDCTIDIHPGAGGTESCDWALMLFRMYERYALKEGFTFQVEDYQPGDEAGIKSVSFSIKGKYAYGYLKGESGVHRLVRISPFDAKKKRHTSFASAEVIPIIEEDNTIIINDEDLKIDVYHSSGAGGQSVNTTDSAVRITHKPTNIVVTCQNERSQLQNKAEAMKILKGKLLNLKLIELEKEKNALRGEKKEIAWGSQIRSYVFCPYQQVKDHRTLTEVNQVDDVMNGEIDIFLTSYLKSLRN